MPGTSTFVLLVLVTEISALGVSGRVLVSVLLVEFGSAVPLGGATVAILLSVPVAVLETVAVSVKVAEPPTSRFTAALILPVPFAVPQLEPDDAVQVHDAFVSVLGKLSVTVAPVTALGPALLTTMV